MANRSILVEYSGAVGMQNVFFNRPVLCTFLCSFPVFRARSLNHSRCGAYFKGVYEVRLCQTTQTILGETCALSGFCRAISPLVYLMLAPNNPYCTVKGQNLLVSTHYGDMYIQVKCLLWQNCNHTYPLLCSTVAYPPAEYLHPSNWTGSAVVSMAFSFSFSRACPV